MIRKLLFLALLGLALSAVGVEAVPDKEKNKPKDAPEFDPRAAGAALALLAGGAWVLSERIRRGPDRG
jgi:hypothetical protein